MSVSSAAPTGILARVADDIASLPADQWDACAGPANPFVSHGFLSAMEESGSVGPGTGWKSLPIIIEDKAGKIAACLPSYLKSHSQGEYIFDQQWAHAYENAGGQYYPKIQIAAPFSPVPGPRLLLRDASLAVPLLRAAEQLAENNGISSVHATFISEDQLDHFREAGWMIQRSRRIAAFALDFPTFSTYRHRQIQSFKAPIMNVATTHEFHRTSLREYDIRGIIGETLGAEDAYAIGRGFGTLIAR